MIQSENERLRGELERRPPVLTAQLSLLPTDTEDQGEVNPVTVTPPKTTGEDQGKPICPFCQSSKVKSNGNRKRKDGSLVTGPDGQPIKRFKCLNPDCGKGF
jgi:hypothetical protein